jgi:hypothetical protein
MKISPRKDVINGEDWPFLEYCSVVQHALSSSQPWFYQVMFVEGHRLWLQTGAQWGLFLHLCPLGTSCWVMPSLCLVDSPVPWCMNKSAHGKSTSLTLYCNSCWNWYPPTLPHISQWQILSHILWFTFHSRFLSVKPVKYIHSLYMFCVHTSQHVHITHLQIIWVW